SQAWNAVRPARGVAAHPGGGSPVGAPIYFPRLPSQPSSAPPAAPRLRKSTEGTAALDAASRNPLGRFDVPRSKSAELPGSPPMTLPRAYEDDLVERAKLDPAAFGELYDHYVGQIYRFVYSRLRT